MKKKKSFLIAIIIIVLFAIVCSNLNSASIDLILSLLISMVIVAFFLILINIEAVKEIIIALGLMKRKSEKEDIIKHLENIDLNFNKETFLQWVESVFTQMHLALSNKDLDKLMIIEDKELYAKHKTEVEQYKRQKRTHCIEILSVNYKDVIDYMTADGYEFVEVGLIATIRDYIKDDETGKTVKWGCRDGIKMTYNLLFKRKEGMLTAEVGELNKIVCPGCGAPIDISVTAECEYCNSIVNTSMHNWILTGYLANLYQDE